MGILRKTALLLAMAPLAYSAAVNPPAYAAGPPTRSGAPASAVSDLASPANGPGASKRASGPQRFRASSSTAPRDVQPAPSLGAFTDRVSHGAASEVLGLYLDGRVALHVVHQPTNDRNYVSAVPGTATLFSLAAETGTLGFLAHREAGGAAFASLSLGDSVRVIYGDGRTEAFTVSEIDRYQALEPSDPYADFVDLGSGEQLSAAQVFQRVYGSGRGLVLQTCLPRDGDLSWGRLFVLAEPIG